MKITNYAKYQQAVMCFAKGHNVIANILLRAAYGVRYEK